MHIAERHVKDVRPHASHQFMGHQGYELARERAQGVKDVMREMGCAGEPLAVDRLDGNGFRALADLGVEVTGPTPATVDAREVKTPRWPTSRPPSVPASASTS